MERYLPTSGAAWQERGRVAPSSRPLQRPRGTARDSAGLSQARGCASIGLERARMSMVSFPPPPGWKPRWAVITGHGTTSSHRSQGDRT